MELKSYGKGNIVEALKRLGIDVDEYVKMDFYTAEDTVCDKLNERLKSIDTYPKFQEFMRDMASFGMDFEIVGKRRSYRIFDFEYVKYDEFDRVYFLRDDSVSTGEAYVKNMYKYYKIIK